MGSIDRTGTGFDVIGDIHGCHSQLVELLHTLGYHDESGYFRHPTRQAIFVGDLIDRGPEQVAVINTVRAMHREGSALVVMGNHEFNAVCWSMAHQNGEPLRPHHDKNRNQHRAFLDQVGENSTDHAEIIDWFRTLPLWIDLGELRVVHACWDFEAVNGIESDTLETAAYVEASLKDSNMYRWVEHLCKGPEVVLPEGYEFSDKDGHVRRKARYRWWRDGENTYRNMCEVPSPFTLPDIDIEDPPVQPYRDSIPVLFGHYWRSWPHAELSSTKVCVDHSAVKDGHLVAYRWDDGDTQLHLHNLVGIK